MWLTEKEANALLRFMYFSGGKLCIDGRDITKVNLEELRSRITMIPQGAPPSKLRLHVVETRAKTRPSFPACV